MSRQARRLVTVVGLMFGVMLVAAAPAFAQEEMASQESLNTVFFLVCMALVFLMHPGFAMLEAGLTKSSNAGNIMMKNMMVVAVSFLTYYAIGWGLMYGSTVGGIFGGSDFFIVPGTYQTALGDYDFLASELMFDAVFAATAATIVSGAVAGRMNIWGFGILAVFMTAVIYPIVGHWGWGGGFLAENGFLDFAGSTVVHLTGGVAAITAAAILGPRVGKFDANGKPRFMPGHSSPLAILGVFLLFFGWFGFNGGSVLNAEVSVGPVLLTTALAGSAGALTAAVYSAFRAKGKTDVSMTGNGLLAGLVGITAGADSVEPYAAILVGVVAGILVSIAVPLVERKGIDDAVGAFSVHGICGVLGTWWVGFYAVDGGLFYGGGASLFVWAVIGTVSVTVFVAAATAAICFGLKSAGLLRLPDDVLDEDKLDIHEHGVSAYPEGVLAGAGD